MAKARYIVIIVSLLALITLSTSCDKIQGCTDSESTNYNAEAEEDDGSCIYPADILAGTWQVVETVSGPTITYNEYYESQLVKVDNNTVSVSAERDSVSEYFYNNAEVIIDWDLKELTGPYTMKGTITNENEIMFNYVHDMNSSSPSIVKLEYTR